MTLRHNRLTTGPRAHNGRTGQGVESAGEPCRIRTCDQLIKRPHPKWFFAKPNNGMADLVVTGSFKAVQIGSHQNMADCGGVRERCLYNGLPGASGATGRMRDQWVSTSGATP